MRNFKQSGDEDRGDCVKWCIVAVGCCNACLDDAGGSVVVKALRYKPGGRGFETR
jgi:hypothetical protein